MTNIYSDIQKLNNGEGFNTFWTTDARICHYIYYYCWVDDLFSYDVIMVFY